VSLAGGAREPKVGLRLKSQISYRQTGVPYNTRSKRMDNTASGNNPSYELQLTGLRPDGQLQKKTRVPTSAQTKAARNSSGMQISSYAITNRPRRSPNVVMRHEPMLERPLVGFSCARSIANDRITRAKALAKEELSAIVPGGMLRANPRATDGAWNQPSPEQPIEAIQKRF
jgi:hypothetical protein